MTLFATIVYVIGIVGLFWLVADSRRRTSVALWLPVIWFLINASRPLSFWFGVQAARTPDAIQDGSPVDRAIFLALIAVAILVLVGRGARVASILRTNWPILLFITYCLIS